MKNLHLLLGNIKIMIYLNNPTQILLTFNLKSN